jgi:glycosyltransferase involved in cell wall biosynthesis
MIPNSTTPLVTILMPFYNAGKGFKAALTSILNQTYENWELLLCDDGSTDGSLTIARSIRDERVIVWSDGKRKGLAGRLNECIDRARGEFMARMDADDVSYPERFLKQVEFLLSHPEIDLVGCEMLIFGEDGSPLGQRRLPEEHEGIVARPHLGFGLAHPTWMARATWFRKFRYDPAALRYEDAEMLYRSFRSSRFANLPEILYGYREVRGGVWKRLQTRMGRVRYLKTHAGTGRATYYRAAAAEAVKTVFDAALVATSARYAMLRLREQSLAPEEAGRWRNVFDLVSCVSPQVRPANPLRLLVMTTVPETIESFFQRQIRLLSQSGFEVHVVCAPGRPLPGLENLPGVTTYRVPMDRRPDPWRDAVSVLRLFRLIRRLRPDIVHAHTPKAGLLGMIAARAAGVRVRLYTIHGLPLMTRKGMWRRVLASAERTSCTLATQVYSVSPSLETVATEMKLCRADKVSTIGDGSCAGIDVERFRSSDDVRKRATALRRSCGVPDDALVLSFVGRIARDKGIAILASAWSRLAKQFPHAHLLFAGAEDLSDRVPGAALQKLRLHDRVHFTGDWLVDMPALYAATDIVVLPTFREGLPQVALEAGAMGVPIVSTRVPGVVNAVQDGVTGLLVPAGESAPFADAVRRLIDDAALRIALGSASREFVRERFSEQRVNQLWISEYRKLVSRSLPGFVNRLAHIETPR